MTIFDQTETLVSHKGGKFVKYDNKTLAIGGYHLDDSGAYQWGFIVEELNPTKLSWTEHPMSPVKNSSKPLLGFTALTDEKSLFIFDRFSVIEWDGTSWERLEKELCRNSLSTEHLQTTFVYAGEIYHIGGLYRSENNISLELFR